MWTTTKSEQIISLIWPYRNIACSPPPLIGDKFILHGMRIGYNSITDDFNVVRIGYGPDPCTVAKICSLKTDSRRVKMTTISLSYFLKALKLVFYDDMYYWSFFGLRNTFILCFNLQCQEFYKLQLPKDFYSQFKAWTISKLNGSLSLILYPIYEYLNLVIEVWVLSSMAPYDHVSWKKLLTIGPLHPCVLEIPFEF